MRTKSLKSSAAFAPSSISAFFSPYEGASLESTGALGLRFTLNTGLRAQVRQAHKTSVFVHNELWKFDLIHKAVCDLPPATIKLFPDHSFGCGFGMSGAALLATLTALNELFSIGMSQHEIARRAHIAEVASRTGRGDVASQITGGVTLSCVVGAPFKVSRLRINEKPLFVRSFGPLSTSEVLGDAAKRRRISRIGRAAVSDFLEAPIKSFTQAISRAQDFVGKTGLLQSRKVAEALESIRARGGHGSMIMLGEGLFSTIPFPGSKEVRISKRTVELI